MIVIFKFIFALVILFLVFGGASFYIARKFHKGLLCFFKKLPFWPILLIFSFFAIVMVFGFGRSALPFPSIIENFFGILSAYYIGIFIYLFIFSVLADLILIIPKLLNLSFIHHRFFNAFIAVFILVCTLITSIYGFVNITQIKHVSYNISIKNKTDISDLNLVLISDLHLGAVGSESRLKSIVNEINSLKPDLICIAGDFFDTDFSAIKNPDDAIKTLKQLRSTYGTYACLGNHDAGQTVNKMLDFLESANINLLNDEYTLIDNRFILVGRLDRSPIGGYKAKKRGELSDFLTVENSKTPIIVMDHNPKNIGQYSNVDLILCGHTHNGQLFPANIVTSTMYDVDYGYYRENPSSPQVVVTSGIGYWGMPMRVGTNCEIVSISFSK